MIISNIMVNNDIPPVRDGHPPFPAGKHIMSYEIFYDLCRDRNFPLSFCSPYDYDWSTGCFQGGFQKDDTGFFAEEDPIKPGFIFDKAYGADPHCTAVIKHCEARGIRIFGPTRLADLCNDKWLIYRQFHQFSPLTWLLALDRQGIVDQIHAFFGKMDEVYTNHDNRAVVKPLHGFQSRGIHLISRHPDGLHMNMLFGGQLHGQDIDRNLDVMAAVPYMIQAWVNTGAGIPGIGLKNQFHDVRFVFHIKRRGTAEFIMLYVKTLEGMKYIPLDAFKVSNPFETVDPVADWLASRHDYGVFSVDVMRDISGRWFLTEINDQVGLTMNVFDEVEREETMRFMQIYIEDMQRFLIP